MTLKLNDWRRFVGFFIVTLLFFTITGCAPAVIVVPVAATVSGVGLLFWLFVVTGFLSMFEAPPKTITPEQMQQQQIALQKQEAEQRLREEMDLPAGLTPSSTNYVRTNESIAMSIIVVTSRTLSPNHTFEIYYKSTSVNSVWQRAEITNVAVQNPDNLENAGLVNRRLLFNIKESIFVDDYKVIVTWNN